jgi:hypothetical protein
MEIFKTIAKILILIGAILNIFEGKTTDAFIKIILVNVL